MNAACKTFDRLVAEFFEVWCRYHPGFLSARDKDCRGRLPPVDDDETSALTGWLETALVGLEELSFRQLDEPRQRELHILFGVCQLEYTSLLERDWRRIDPYSYIRSIELCQQDLSAEPLAEYLRRARDHLSSFPEFIPLLWAYAAALSLDHLLNRMQQQLLNPRKAAVDLPQSLQTLEDFQGFILDLCNKANGDAAQGSQRLSRILKLRYMLPEKLGCYADIIQSAADKVEDAGAQWQSPAGNIESQLVPPSLAKPISVSSIFASVAMQRSWELYLGWLQADAKKDFSSQLQLQTRLAGIDLEFHSGHISQAEAQQRLESDTFLATDEVAVTLLAISQHPGRELAILVYFRLLQDIARSHCHFAAQKMQDFHQQIHVAGAVPLPLISLRFLDKMEWRQPLQKILPDGAENPPT